jgi:hypothetical protein
LRKKAHTEAVHKIDSFSPQITPPVQVKWAGITGLFYYYLYYLLSCPKYSELTTICSNIETPIKMFRPAIIIKGSTDQKTLSVRQRIFELYVESQETAELSDYICEALGKPLSKNREQKKQ